MNTTILAIKTHALGDVLLTTPSIHRLRQTFPDARILFLTTERCAPLLSANPDIHTLITIPDLRMRPVALKRLFRIRHHKPHIAVVFQCSSLALAAARLTGADHIVYLDKAGRAGDRFSCQWPPSRHQYTGDAYQCLVTRLAPDAPVVSSRPRLFISPADDNLGRTMLAEYGLNRHSYCVVAPGGGKNERDHVPFKLWPPGRFVSLIRRIQSSSGIPVVLVGDESDAPMTQYITSQTAHGTVDLSGVTTLSVLSTIVRDACFVVSHDSLPLHIAIAFKTPLIGIFGPTSPSNFIPSEAGEAVDIRSSARCSPCYGNEIFPGCKQGTAVCMGMIGVDEVFGAVERILRTRPVRERRNEGE